MKKTITSKDLLSKRNCCLENIGVSPMPWSFKWARNVKDSRLMTTAPELFILLYDILIAWEKYPELNQEMLNNEIKEVLEKASGLLWEELKEALE